MEPLKRINHAMSPSNWIAVIATAAVFISGLLTNFAQQPEDMNLQSFFKNYLDERFRQRPLEASRLGDHRFDHLLDDISQPARQQWLAFARKTLASLPQQVDYKKLSRDRQIDFEIFQHELKTQIWLANHTRPFEEDPRIYGGYINDGVYV